MPHSALKVCQRPGCGALCNGRFCKQHAGAAPAIERRRVFDRERGSACARGYGRRHQRLRKLVLARDPLCTVKIMCDGTAPSTDYDHMVPLAEGGENTLENAAGACHACHSYKTATEDSRFIRWRKPGARDRSKRVG
jgi:5-methylcytosine-specific restriction enzyme A